MDVNLFFPNENPRVNDRRIPRAKAVCAACPVWEDCLDWALENPRIAKGVYGGLLERERRRLARKPRNRFYQQILTAAAVDGTRLVQVREGFTT